MLMQAGLPSGQPGELITLENPDIVADVHRQYADAGARVVITNTFNSNRFRLDHCSLADKLIDCNRIATRLARQIASSDQAVAGSMGPTGELLAPSGTLSPEHAQEAFAEQAAALDAEGVDFFLVETMFDLQEALAGIRACRQVSNKPIVASMTYSKTPRGFYTMMGNSPADAVPQLLDAGAFAVGANCQVASETMVELAGVMREITDAPLWIKPNAGQPDTSDSTLKYEETPEIFAASVLRIAQLGIELIGGCCGTTPAHIARAREVLAENGFCDLN